MKHTSRFTKVLAGLSLLGLTHCAEAVVDAPPADAPGATTPGANAPAQSGSSDDAAALQTNAEALELEWVIATLFRPPNRGIWMHNHTGHVYGTSTIVGDDAREAWAVSRLNSWRVDRVYGGYGPSSALTAAHRTDIATWNQRLDNAGIDSQLLLGAPHFIFPGADCRDRLLEQIQERLIDFHDDPPGTPLGTSLGATARFDGLHLDVEPHQFKAGYYGTGTAPSCATDASAFWGEATASRAELFAHLYDTYVDVRVFLDTNGYADLPLHVDLPYWVDGTSFNWGDAPAFTDAYDWLDQAGDVVDSMTFMTYERNTAALIRDAIEDERITLGTAPQVRASVNAKERSPHSSIHTWSLLSYFWTVVSQVENTWGEYRYPVDLHNFRYMASSWPIEWISATFAERLMQRGPYARFMRRLLALEAVTPAAPGIDEPHEQLNAGLPVRGDGAETEAEASEGTPRRR